MNFGELIKAKRVALGLTLQEVGDAAGLSTSYVCELESGKKPNPGLLACVRLSVALGLTLQAVSAAIEPSAKEQTK